MLAGAGRHKPEAHPEAELVSALEPDQLTAVSDLPLPPARVTRSLRFALFALRIFSLLITVIVVYVFIFQIRHPS